MAEITTTAQAPSNPTAPGPLTTAAPATQPNAQRRPRAGAIADHQYDRLEPAERGRYARVRKAGPDGGSEWVHRDQLGKEPPADGSAAPPADGKYRYGQYEFTETEIADLMRFKGETELRRAAVPADPSQYKVELPADVVMPPGVEWKWNDADPLEVARNWAHKQGLTQPQFAELLGQYAGMEAQKEFAYQTALKRGSTPSAPTPRCGSRPSKRGSRTWSGRTWRRQCVAA